MPRQDRRGGTNSVGQIGHDLAEHTRELGCAGIGVVERCQCQSEDVRLAEVEDHAAFGELALDVT